MTSDGGEQAREAAMRDPGTLIRRAGARGNPDHDQHFLVNDRVVDRIPTYPPEETDCSHVLGIDGGSGILTDRLLGMADRVTVAEQDRTLAAYLRCEFAGEVRSDRLTVVKDGAFDVNLPGFTACVLNLPCDISSEISLRLFLRGKPLVLMSQEKFGERMVAEAGISEHDRLSVNTQYYGEVELCEHAPHKALGPKPAVQSVVVRITPRKPEYEADDEAFFLDFVKALSTQWRKTTRNGIHNTMHVSGLSDPEAAVETADEDVLRKRAGNMALTGFAELAQLAASVGH